MALKNVQRHFFIDYFARTNLHYMAIAKQHILLLHGAIGAAGQMQPLKEQLSERYDAHTLHFSGHGGRQMPDEVFSIPLFAQDVLAYMDLNGWKKTVIFGYSMGGYVAMYLARHHPEKVEKLITLGTKFIWDEAIASKEIKMLQADKIEEKLPAFANTLKQRHAPNDWKEVLKRTAAMLWQLGQNNLLDEADYNMVSCPCSIMRGEADNMVSEEEGVFVCRNLKQASLVELQNTPHPIEKAPLGILVREIESFLEI